MKFLKRTLLTIVLIVTLCMAGCSVQANDEKSSAEYTLFAMNTYMTFTANGENAEIALEEAAHLVEKLENLWSVTDENSEIYKANHNYGLPKTINKENSELICFALEMAKKTNGALEPTIYPVLTAWGFTADNKRVPHAEEITELLKNVDYSRIELNGAELTVPDEMQLDLGAVAKGYTADLKSSRSYPYTRKERGSIFIPYAVKVDVQSIPDHYLNIRELPTTESSITGKITESMSLTITAEVSGKGASKWGKLKSGAGWSSLDYTKRH